MKITIITTGGSIDKDYPRATKGYAFEITEPAVGRILGRIKPDLDFEIIQLLKKDSLDITDTERDEILKAVQDSDSDKVLITHGTDTMLDTAQKLAMVKDKTVVITGATRPERFSDSDAEFNLGSALTALDILENGVYIVMQGLVYPWDKCTRDEVTGRFSLIK
jgi:L-asparaginase